MSKVSLDSERLQNNQIEDNNKNRLKDSPPQKPFKDYCDEPDEEKKKKNDRGIFSLMSEQRSPSTVEAGCGIEEIKPSSELEALFEKLADVLVHESKKGISETTIRIQSKDPRFLLNGTEFRIKHYDTHPHSFHIQFCGTESSINYFQNHMNALSNRLQKALSEFQIHFTPPILLHQEELFSRKTQNLLKANKMEKLQQDKRDRLEKPRKTNDKS